MDELKQKISDSFGESEISLIIGKLNSIECLEEEQIFVKSAILDLANGNLENLKALIKHFKKKPEEVLYAFDTFKEYESTKNDIQIGDGNTINWVDFESFERSNKLPDELLSPIQLLLDGLETECQSMCCGIGAYSFYPETIKEASTRLNDKNIGDKLGQIVSKLETIEEEIVSVSGMNQSFHKSVFIKLLNHIKSNV